MAVSRLSIVKFIELALTVACVAIHYKTISRLTPENSEHFLLVTGTFCGYLVILLGSFAGHLMGTPIGKRIDIFYSLVGSALFIASGIFTIQAYDDSIFSSKETKNWAMTKGALAIINGVVFLIDGFFTYRD